MKSGNTMKFSNIGRIFLTGLAAILPIAVTLAILWWLGAGAERLLGRFLKYFIPDHWYSPGMGIALGLLLVFAVGLLTRAWLFQKAFSFGDRLFNRIPLVKTVYGAVQDFTRFISGNANRNFNRVVTVEVQGAYLIGFVTCDDSQHLPAPLDDEDRIAVYFPMSYQIGGYTLFIPRNRITPVNMGMEDAMRFVVTAGLSGRNRKGKE